MLIATPIPCFRYQSRRNRKVADTACSVAPPRWSVRAGKRSVNFLSAELGALRFFKRLQTADRGTVSDGRVMPR